MIDLDDCGSFSGYLPKCRGIPANMSRQLYVKVPWEAFVVHSFCSGSNPIGLKLNLYTYHYRKTIHRLFAISLPHRLISWKEKNLEVFSSDKITWQYITDTVLNRMNKMFELITTSVQICKSRRLKIGAVWWIGKSFFPENPLMIILWNLSRVSKISNI